MIIICINCSKNFNVDSSLIPHKGRLLQCNDCKYKWFFKNEDVTSAKIEKPINQIKESPDPIEIKSLETIDAESIENLVSFK
ncbi:zinc-ribbon domain-containing protein, partial [Candidatus Pelagibacter sp.]|nr:zinc-ribbon domain-containing protein [Candidatus Pelagibacter sp.]